MQSLPSELYEAADVDGATPWQKFVGVTLPLLKPLILVALIIRGMDAVREFDIIFIMTGGGPGNATTFLSQYLTQKAVGQFDLGPAAAFSLIYFLIILLFCFVLYNWMQRVGTGDGK
jgi:glycerol transport system permease protein